MCFIYSILINTHKIYLDCKSIVNAGGEKLPIIWNGPADISPPGNRLTCLYCGPGEEFWPGFPLQKEFSKYRAAPMQMPESARLKVGQR